jgi:hypothetical protein
MKITSKTRKEALKKLGTPFIPCLNPKCKEGVLFYFMGLYICFNCGRYHSLTFIDSPLKRKKK